MARPSKLSPMQWDEIRRRHAAGEAAANLAREFGVSDAAVSKRVSKISQIVKNLAVTLADTQREIELLPPRDQYQVHSLAEKLKSMTHSLASAAELGAKTAHRLQALANNEAAKLDDSDPMTTGDSVKAIMVLTKTANEAGAMALGMVAGAGKGALPPLEAAPYAEEVRAIEIVPIDEAKD